MKIPPEAIAEYVTLKARIASLVRIYPSIDKYFSGRVQLVASEDQMLMNLQSATASDREAEDKAKRAIGLLSLRMSEEDAVVKLAIAFADEGCLDAAIRKVLG